MTKSSGKILLISVWVFLLKTLIATKTSLAGDRLFTQQEEIGDQKLQKIKYSWE